MSVKINNFIKSILPKPVLRWLKNYRKKLRVKSFFSTKNKKYRVKEMLVEDVRYQINLEPFANAGVDYVIYHEGGWEPHISRVIKRYLPREGTFLDIGANIGYHTLFAASYLNEKGQVWAFEPIPWLVTQLRSSLKLNNLDNVQIENYALGDHNEKTEISIIDGNIGASRLGSVLSEERVAAKIPVAVTTLDSYQEQFGRLDVVKIDVEGRELEALRGGRHLLEKFHPVIVMEFSPSIYEADYQGKAKDLISFLTALGYRFYDSKTNEELSVEQILSSDLEQQDIVCR